MPGELTGPKKRTKKRAVKTNEANIVNTPVTNEAEIFSKLEKRIQDIPQYSDTSEFPIINEPEIYQQDADIVFFLNQYKSDFQNIETLINDIPDESLSPAEKSTLISELFSKLPPIEKEEPSESYLMSGLKTIASFLPLASANTIPTDQREKRFGILSDINKKLTELLDNANDWLDLKELLRLKEEFQKQTKIKQGKAQAYAEQLKIKADNLQQCFDKTNHTSIQKAPERENAEKKISDIKNAIKTINIISVQKVKMVLEPNAGYQDRIQACHQLIKNILNEIKQIEGVWDRVASIGVKELDATYRSRKNQILESRLGRNIIEYVDIELQQLVDVAGSSSEQQASDLLSKLEFIHRYSNNQAPSIFTAFCKSVTNHGINLTEAETLAQTDKLHLQKFFELIHLYRSIKAMIEENPSKNNELVETTFNEYLNVYSNQKDNRLSTATDCIELYKKLHRFLLLISDINCLKQVYSTIPTLRLTAIKLREPTSHGLSAGPSDVERFMVPANKPRDVGEENDLNLMAVTPRSIEAIFVTYEQALKERSKGADEQLTQLENYRNERMELFYESKRLQLEQICNRINSIKILPKPHLKNSFAPRLNESKQSLVAQCMELNQLFDHRPQQNMLNLLDQWNSEFNANIQALENEYQNTRRDLLRSVNTAEERLNAAYYSQSLEMIENINQEISRICSEKIAAAQRRLNLNAIDNLIKAQDTLILSRTTNLDNEPYRLLSKQIPDDLLAEIDARLPILINLRNEYTQLNSNYEAMENTVTGYKNKIFEIIENTLNQDNLMHLSDDDLHPLIQFFRQYILYPLAKLARTVLCRQADNPYHFFGTCIGAGSTERRIAEQSLSLDYACRSSS